MSFDPTPTPWVRHALVAGLLLGIVLLTFVVLQPFLVPLIWGGILAYVAWPLHSRLLPVFRGRAGFSALGTSLIVTLAIIVPIVWLGVMVNIEAGNAYKQVQAFLISDPNLPPTLRDLPWVGPWLQEILQQLKSNPETLGEQMAGQFSSEATRVIGGVGRNAVKMFFAVLSMFFLLRDGPRVFGETRVVLESVFGPRVRDYLDAVGATTQAVVYALILGAIAQGFVAGLGYWIFGVKAPVLLGAMTALIALIPFGAPMVWGSLSIWLLLTGNIWAGAGLALWGVLLVSWMDNIVRPLVISNATRMPFLLVVFGVLGGVLAFGLVGLFVGPVLLAVSLALWREWLEQHQPPEAPPAS